MKAIYSGAWVAFAYSLSTVLLLIGITRGGWLWFYLTLAFFVVWDAGWLLADETVRDRSAEDMLASSTRARTHMSWFLTVYGAVLAFFLFQGTPEAQKNFFILCRDAQLNPLLFVLPFALTGVALLFFPIKLGKDKGLDLKTAPASIANITIVIVVIFAQKVAIFSFLYAVFRLLYYSWRRSGI